MKLRYRINGSVIAALTACLAIAGSAVADAPPVDLAVKSSDVAAMNGPQATDSAAPENGDSGNPQCAAFEADPKADVGDILRAGCKPTLAQMSALMDNPLGNVAMLFTQFDLYQMKEPTTGKREDKYNYM